MNLEEITKEILNREPLFHHPEFGRTRYEIDKYVDENFWEVGASGKIYDRDLVLDTVSERYLDPLYLGVHSGEESKWNLYDFTCRKISDNVYLATYQLDQVDRKTFRSTIWKYDSDNFKIMYHQGTIINEDN